MVKNYYTTTEDQGDAMADPSGQKIPEWGEMRLLLGQRSQGSYSSWFQRVGHDTVSSTHRILWKGTQHIILLL